VDENISIETWAFYEAARLFRFVEWWQRNCDDKEPFPQALPLGEWDEQFRFFDD
jgi:hypothetical protein